MRLGDVLVAETQAAYRVLETSHPPSWYLPPAALQPGTITPSRARSTWCEWKGAATYWDVLGEVAAAWSYEAPTGGFGMIAGYLAFAPDRLVCEVDGERARPQAGGFYGGWITSDVVGPFKGGPAPRAGEPRRLATVAGMELTHLDPAGAAAHGGRVGQGHHVREATATGRFVTHHRGPGAVTPGRAAQG